MTSKFTTGLAGALLGAALLAGQAMAQPKSLTLGTASVGGTYFIYGGVVATLLTEKTGINVSTQQTQGPNQNMILTNGKNIELGMVTMGVALHGWNGTGWANGKKYDDVRAVFPMYDTPFHFITTERSGIKSVADMAGKNVGVGPRAGTPGTYFPMMFDALGIKVTIRNGGASDMASQLGDGLLDVFAFAAGVPIAAYSELEAQRPVRFIRFTDAELKTLQEKIPELSPSIIPKGTYRTLTEDHPTVGVFNFFIAHKDLPDDVVYNITKAVLENNDAMVKGHSAASETIAANADKNTFLPFHPGAIRYYKEKGIKLNPKTM
ncbi:MAG: TAXI family TRAP transporter solute-binding subunit [Alphaproteobacteria bacterium]|nr:TAXI family TRAP transporter solute-binding subunit [Alphaproteobacteria bacterium]